MSGFFITSAHLKEIKLADSKRAKKINARKHLYLTENFISTNWHTWWGHSRKFFFLSLSFSFIEVIKREIPFAMHRLSLFSVSGVPYLHCCIVLRLQMGRNTIVYGYESFERAANWPQRIKCNSSQKCEWKKAVADRYTISPAHC